jgi:predicted nuclease of restriction endonuclease-like RecB superfamily
MENSQTDANQPVSILTVADLETLLTKIVRKVIKEEMINLLTQQVQFKETNKIDVRELSGMLYEEGRKTVSLEEMEEAISECAGESA